MRTATHWLGFLLSLLAALSFVPLPAGAATGPDEELLFRVTRLPAPFNASGINNHGQIVGTFNNTAAVYTDATFTTLAAIAPGSMGQAINDRGDIAGIWNGRVFLYAGGTFTDTGYAPGDYPMVTALNDARQATGYASFGRAFLYTDGAAQALSPLPGGTAIGAYGINDRGQAVGQSTTLAGNPPAEVPHAFLYQDGRLQDLGTLPAEADSWAFDINERGQVTGSSGRRPILYSDGMMIDIGDPAEGIAQGFAINNHAWVVGAADYIADNVVNFHGFLYADGRHLDLNTLLDEEGWFVERAFDINDAGQILGFACRYGFGDPDPCGYVRLDLVSAIPEPSAWCMLAAGMALLALRRRRLAPACRTARGGMLPGRA